MTGDRLLKIVAFLIGFSFISFSLFVTVREIRKVNDPLRRLINEHCIAPGIVGASTAIEGEQITLNIDSTEALGRIGNDCIFIPVSRKDQSPFMQRIFEHGRLTSHDYLYLGDRGILLIRDDYDYEKTANALFLCLKSNACDATGLDPHPVTVTLSLVGPNGDHPVSVTYTNESLRAILQQSPRLIKEMVTNKKIEPEELPLEIAIHHRYARLDYKDVTGIDKLLKPGLDGLLIFSRGPKIRLLPWEYTEKGLDRLSAKGNQYGLDKLEYKREHAQLFMYRTSQWREYDRSLRSFWGTAAADKAHYSNDILKRYLTRYLLAATDSSTGKITEYISAKDGSDRTGKQGLMTHLAVLDALITALHSGASDVQPAAEIIATHIAGRSAEMKPAAQAYFFALMNKAPGLCAACKQSIDPLRINFQTAVAETAPIQGSIADTPYLIRALFEAAAGDEKVMTALRERTETYLRSVTFSSAEEAARFYSKILPVARFLPGYADTLGEAAAGAFTLISRPEEDFQDTAGALNSAEGPDALLTAAAAYAIAGSKASGLTNGRFDEMLPRMMRFLSFSMMSNQDAQVPSDPAVRKLVMGGIRLRPGSTVLSATATASALGAAVSLSAMPVKP